MTILQKNKYSYFLCLVVIISFIVTVSCSSSSQRNSETVPSMIGITPTVLITPSASKVTATPTKSILSTETSTTFPGAVVTFTPIPLITTPTITPLTMPPQPVTETLKTVSLQKTGWSNFIELYGQYGGVFSPDGSLLAAAQIEKTFVIDVATGESNWVFEKEPAAINGTNEIAFSPDAGRLLANGGPEGIAYIWSVEDGSLEYMLPFGKNITDIEFSHDGSLFAVGQAGEGDGGITIWNLREGNHIQFPQQNFFFGGMAFIPNTSILAITNQGWVEENKGAITLWDVNSSALETVLPINPQDALGISPDGKMMISGLEIISAPNGDKLAALVNDSVYLWDVNTKMEIELEGTVATNSGIVTDLLFSPDNILAVRARTNNYHIILWDSGGKLLGQIESEKRLSTPMFTPDGLYLFVFDLDDGSPSVWEVPS